MVNLTRRSLWLLVPIALGLMAAGLLLAALPARPAQAAAPQLAPAGCDNDLAEPNNVYTEATALSVPGVLYRRYICDVPFVGDQDWYSVTLAAGQQVAIFIRFRHVDGDLDLYLFDTSGQILIASSNGLTNNESISYTVTGAGVYYIEVDGYLTGQGIYDLSISGGCYARAVSEFASVDAKAVRDAVAEAAPGGTVKVAGYCPGTVTEFGEVQTARISKTLTLAGGYAPANWTTPHPMTQPTTLDAMNSGRVISATGSLTVTGLTLQHGASGPTNGGGLRIQGSLVLSGTTFYSNTTGFAGGGASVTGYAAITNSIFNENAALGDRGGGLLVLGATIAGGSFTGNRANSDGGGLHVSNLLNLDGTEFTDNVSQAYGGGAYTGSAAGNSVANAYFSGNEALVAGGLYAGGPLDLVNSAFFSNEAANGGGVASVSAMVISNSTFIGNSSQVGGGAVSTNGPLILDRVTMNNNVASAGNGGGVLSYNSIQVTNTTFMNNVASNDGGGLYLSELDQTSASGAAPTGPPLAPGRLVNVLFVNNSARNATDLAIVAPAAYSLLHGTFWSGSHAVTESIIVANANLTMRNNLFTGYPMVLKRNSGTASEDYNLYFGGGGMVASYLTGTVTSGGHSLVADPLLVDGPTGDYHLTYDSPARDRGTNQGVTDDFEGDPRPYGYGVDIGYDEIVGYLLKISLPAILR